jgi:hypothetical protein
VKWENAVVMLETRCNRGEASGGDRVLILIEMKNLAGSISLLNYFSLWKREIKRDSL